jgi:hypothetical protein
MTYPGSPSRRDYSARWRYPYRDWTASELIIANALRPTPLPLSELCRFQNHKLTSIRQIRANLRQEGRLNADNTVNTDHPTNQSLVGSARFTPLPDPGTTPISTNPLPEPPSTPDSPFSEPKDRKYFAKTLEAWITSGKAGSNTPRFIESWLELVGTAGNCGPPPPTSPSEAHDRLLRLLNSVPKSTADRAIATFQSQLEAPDADTRNPGEAPPRPLPDGEAEDQEIEVQLRPREL